MSPVSVAEQGSVLFGPLCAGSGLTRVDLEAAPGAGVEQTEIALIWISDTTFLEILQNYRVVFAGDRAFICVVRCVLGQNSESRTKE